MACPSDDQWVLLSTNVLESAQASELKEHLLACPSCQEEFGRARREHAALLRSYEALDRDHDKLREQLMASLPTESPGTLSGRDAGRWRRIGEYVMKNPKLRWAPVALAAAACIAFILTLVFGSAQTHALAAIGRAVEQAETLTCRMSFAVVSGGLNQSFEGVMYISDEYGSRTEVHQGDRIVSCTIAPIDGPVVAGHPGGKSLVRFTYANDFPDAPGKTRIDEYITHLQELTGDADRELGTEYIDGAEAFGYEISGERLGLPDVPGLADATVTLWVDAESMLPISYTLRMSHAEAGLLMTIVCEDFEWDVPLEASLFDTSIFDDGDPYLELHMPAATEAALIEGLETYVDFVPDHFPSALDSMRIGMEFYSRTGMLKLGRNSETGDPNEAVQRLMSLYAGVTFYEQLERDGAEPEYFGSTVMPGDADAVLLRWKLDDGEVRVIYGNLHVETQLADTP